MLHSHKNVLSLEKMGVLSQNESVQLRIFEFSRKTIPFNGGNLCSRAELFHSPEKIVLPHNKLRLPHNKLCSLTKLLPKKLCILLQKFYISPSFAFTLNICALRETLHLLTKALNYRFSFIGNSTLRSFTLRGMPPRDRVLNPYRITPIHWLMARRRI